MERIARCQCGQASLTVSGEPTLVTACSCSWRQRRYGRVFSGSSRWPLAQVVRQADGTEVVLYDGAKIVEATVSDRGLSAGPSADAGVRKRPRAPQRRPRKAACD